MHASAAVALATILVALTAPLHAQQPAADPRDFGTIEDIVRVSYEVISGPPGTPRQWRRDSTLYAPGAMFHSLDEDKQGKVSVKDMSTGEQKVVSCEEFLDSCLRRNDKAAQK